MSFILYEDIAIHSIDTYLTFYTLVSKYVQNYLMEHFPVNRSVENTYANILAFSVSATSTINSINKQP